MTEPDERPQSVGEEIANSVSHGMALVAAAAAVPILLMASARHGTALNIAATSVFAATMVLLYAASVLYHAIPHAAAKRLFRKLDHGAIFLFIAGSYTPFALGALDGTVGMDTARPGLGVGGGRRDAEGAGPDAPPRPLDGLLPRDGLARVIAVNPLLQAIPVAGVVLLAAGGLAYTIGVAFFVLDSKLRYAHFVWHLFVVAGTACHYFAVLRLRDLRRRQPRGRRPFPTSRNAGRGGSRPASASMRVASASTLAASALTCSANVCPSSRFASNPDRSCAKLATLAPTRSAAYSGKASSRRPVSATCCPTTLPNTPANACSTNHGSVGASSFNVVASAGSPSAVT